MIATAAHAGIQIDMLTGLNRGIGIQHDTIAIHILMPETDGTIHAIGVLYRGQIFIAGIQIGE